MRAVGIDIAKAGFCAAGLAIDGRPSRVSAWENPNPKDSEPLQLVGFETWLKGVLWRWKPDIVVVEELAVFFNKNTIRTLARREGVALLVAKKRASIVIHPPVTQSRSIVLGSPGNMPKEEAFARMKKLYPDFSFSRANQGGMDEADALCHALAAQTILERR